MEQQLEHVVQSKMAAFQPFRVAISENLNKWLYHSRCLFMGELWSSHTAGSPRCCPFKQIH